MVATHPGRFAGLLLTVLFAAFTLQDAVDAQRTLNKCCAPADHLYFSEDLGYFVCETVLEKAAREQSNKSPVEEVREGDNTTDSVTVDGVEGNSSTYTVDNTIAAIPGDSDDASGFAEQFLAMLSNVSLTEGDVVPGVFPPCFPDATDNTDYLTRFHFRLRPTENSVILQAPGKHEFEANVWCLDLNEEDYPVVVVCPCEGVGKLCVRKCCPNGEVFEDESSCNISALKPWEPTVVDSVVNFYTLKNVFPNCEPRSNEIFHRDELMLLSDMSVKGKNINGHPEKFTPGHFCVDAIAPLNGSVVDGDLLVVFCIEIDDLSDAVTIFKGVVTFLGALALLITVVLTAIFTEMRQNIYGKMALCHNASLLLAFFCIGLVQVGGHIMNKVSCQVLSFVMQYTMLAAFFWLNAMCVEVSRGFSALRPVKKMMAGYVDSKFMWYSVYAWGTTSIISIITIIVEFAPGAKLKPRFGDANCFFHGDDKMPQLLFLFGPMAILFAINVGLFIFTATKIIAHRRQTSILKTDDSNTNNRNKQNLVLYMKLFTLMGVTWIFEIVSWAIGGKNYYWLAIDCVNLLRGVFIFFIFCCKRSVLELVRARLGCADAPEGTQKSKSTKSTAASHEAQEMTDTSASTRRTSDPKPRTKE